MESKVLGYNIETNSWHCTMCGDDMGEHNPRQLCGKYYCRNFTHCSSKRKPLDTISTSDNPDKKLCSPSSKASIEKEILKYKEDIAWDSYIEAMSDEITSEHDDKDDDEQQEEEDDEESHHSIKDLLSDR